MKRLLLACLCGILAMAPGVAVAQTQPSGVPRLITFNGEVTSPGGDPRTGPALVSFRLDSDQTMVAQSGRVRIKVDARYGAIRTGDLLVTSPTTGDAMRSRTITVAGQRIHRPGTILGKALEPLPKGRGEILVLLTLQ